MYVNCLPLCKGHCENKSIKFPSCDGKKQNISILNSQAVGNNRYTHSVLIESSLKGIDSETLASFPTGPSNDLLSELLIYLLDNPELSFPNFTCGNLDSEEFSKANNSGYNDIH